MSPISWPSKETGLLLKDEITKALIHHSSGDRAYDHVQQLSLWDRMGPGYGTAINWIRNKMAESGLEEIELEEYPTEHSEWFARKAELWMTVPYLSKITSFEDLPMSLALNSAPVNITADLIDIGSGLHERDYEGKDVRNKIVLTTQTPNSIAPLAILQKGAIGIVSSYSVPYYDYQNRLPGDFPEQVGWASIRLPQGHDAFAFLISDRTAKELKAVLQQKGKITLSVAIEAEKKSLPITIVSGLIKGQDLPDEEVLITAHADHYKPGANDNASGAAVTLEIARTLTTLIATQQLPRPRRTLRFLWLPEFTGTTCWLEKHLHDGKSRLLNLNFDMVGSSLKQVDAKFSIDYTPGWNGHFINAVAESILDFITTYNSTTYPTRKDYRIIAVNGSRDTFRGVMKPYSRGADHQLFNDVGIAATIFGLWPDNNYHTSQDSIRYIDATQLHRSVFAGLAAAVTGAYTGTDHVEALCTQVLKYGLSRMAREEKRALELVTSSTPDTLPLNTYLARVIVREGASREEQSLQSCIRIAETSSEGAGQYIDKYRDLVRRRKETALHTINELAESLVKRFNTTLPEIEAEQTLVNYRQQIPERIKGKELVTYEEARLQNKVSDMRLTALEQEVAEKLAALQEQEVEALRLFDFYNAIASFANGIRNLVDIRNAIYAEYQVFLSLESIETLFSVLEAAGAVKYK